MLANHMLACPALYGPCMSNICKLMMNNSTFSFESKPVRPTTNDIAKKADVSLATVDRVLNNRAGVSPKTRERVNEAIKKLGYIRDVSAANLAKKRRYKMAFVLPDEESQFQLSLQDAINLAASHGFADRTEIIRVGFPPNDPHALVATLRRLQKRKVDGIAIMAAGTPHVRDAIGDLKLKGIAVVALVSDQPDSDCDHFVGINNVAAGRSAAVLMGRFLPQLPGKIVVLTNSMQSHDSVDRRLGFDDVILDRFPHLEVLPTLESHGDPVKIAQVLETVLENNDDVVGVYSLSSGIKAMLKGVLKNRKGENLTVIAHELTPYTREALHEGTIDAVITQNTGHIVRSALRVLRAKSDEIPIDNSQERIRIEIVIRENLDEQ